MRVGACLSLSGRYARFGGQAALGLRAWRSLAGSAELVLEDDRSDARTLTSAIRRLAEDCDLLLGPYSTHLMRTAGHVAAAKDRLLWNHGGAGDQVQAGSPGHVVSVTTPCSRYAEPFLHHLADNDEAAELWIARGTGSFGRQVADGAERLAHQLGIPVVQFRQDQDMPDHAPTAGWDLFCAGSFESDAETVRRAQSASNPPRLTCAVAAGVGEFGAAVDDPGGVFGVGQWYPDHREAIQIGPSETAFLAEYAKRTEGFMPDYPAVQAAAAAVLATECAHRAGSFGREELWSVAAELRTSTLFGGFAIDPYTGAQVEHRMRLVRWSRNGPSVVR